MHNNNAELPLIDHNLSFSPLFVDIVVDDKEVYRRSTTEEKCIQLDKLDITNAEHSAIHVNEPFQVSGNEPYLSDATQPHEILYNLKIQEDETFLDNHQNDLSHIANLLAIPWSSDDGRAYPSAEVSYTSNQSELLFTRPLTECCINSMHSRHARSCPSSELVNISNASTLTATDPSALLPICDEATAADAQNSTHANGNVSFSIKKPIKHVAGFDSITETPIDKELLEAFSKKHLESSGQTTTPSIAAPHPRQPHNDRVAKGIAKNNTMPTVNFKVVSQNVRGIGNIKTRDKTILRLKSFGDILFLQETYTTKDSQKSIENKYKNDKIFFSHGSSHSRGTMVIFKSRLDVEILNVDNDADGRFNFITCTIQGLNFLLANVYAPTSNEEENSAFITKITEKLIAFQADPIDYIIAGGDWNFTENIDSDRLGGNPKKWNNSIRHINNFKDTLDLVDYWRIKNPEKISFTWKSLARGIFSRIDRFYVSVSLQHIIESTDILPSGTYSDHSVIQLTIKGGELKKGPGLWRLNTSLLKNLEYTNEIRKLIIDLCKDDYSDKRTQFDYIKFKIKEKSIAISKKIAKSNREEIEKAELGLKEAEAKLIITPNCTDLKKQVYECQAILEKQYQRINEGLIIQSRVQYYEEGEKGTQFFLNTIKRNANKTTIRKIKIDENSQLITDQNMVMKEIENFYKSLYTSKRDRDNVTIEDVKNWISFLKDNGHIPQLDDDDRNLLEQELDADDLEIALKTFGNNKSPGSDGLPYEFYKHFWNELKMPMLDSFMEAIEKGEMSTSQKQSFIRLIPKKEKDPIFIKNWRPLNQSNSDTKTYAKWIASLLLQVIEKLVHPSQSAYIRGRFIGEGIKVIEGIIEYIRQLKLQGYILAIDFEKAFDSLEWDFLIEVLYAFGFPEKFIHHIRTLYKNIETCVLNGGTTTGSFLLSRAIKQGCPASGLLFILVIEVFSIKIRISPEIEGITIKNETFKQTSFADDLETFLKNIKSMKLTLKELELFGRVSGLKCNVSKCEAMALGKSIVEPIEYMGETVKWVETMKITGITFSKNIEACREANFECAIEKLKTQLNLWKQRDLSLIGKIQIIKTFGISQLQYVMNMVTPPDHMLKTVKKLLNNFLWGSNINRIKHTTMIADYDNGGLKMPDINAIFYAQRVMWMRRYFNTEYKPWKVFFEWQIEKIGGLTIFKNSSIEVREIANKGLMSFYESIITAWALYYNKPLDEGNFKKQVLHFNKNIITPAGKSLFHPSLIEKGIVFIYDIVHNKRLKTPNEMKMEKNLNGIELMYYASLYSCIKRMPSFSIYLENSPEYVILPDTRAELFGENSKSVYRKLIAISAERPVSETKLPTMLQIQPDKFKNMYRLPFLVTLETKMRAFQFKINHLIYYTNEMLYRNNQGIVESPNCTFCREHIETQHHIFIECRHVKPLWTDIEIILDQKLSDTDKMLGCFLTMANKKYDVISHITILVKYYIHICRIKGTVPCSKVLKRRILYSQFLESEIAKKKGKNEEHDKKWNLFLENFSS